MKNIKLIFLATIILAIFLGACMPIGFVEGSGSSYYCSKGHETEFMKYPTGIKPLPLIQNPNNSSVFRVNETEKGFYIYCYFSGYEHGTDFSLSSWSSECAAALMANAEYYAKLKGRKIKPILQPFGWWKKLWYGYGTEEYRRSVRIDMICWNEETGYACCSPLTFVEFENEN